MASRLRPYVTAAGAVALLVAIIALRGVPLPWALGVTWAAATLMHATYTPRRPARRADVPELEHRPARRGRGTAPCWGARRGVLYTSTVAASPRHRRRPAARRPRGRVGVPPASSRPGTGGAHITYWTGRARVPERVA